MAQNKDQWRVSEHGDETSENCNVRGAVGWLSNWYLVLSVCRMAFVRSFVDSVAFCCQHLTNCNTLRPHIKLFLRHFFRCQCDMSRSVGRKDPQFLAAT